nr:hypothetical protein CR513_59335 [Ipomoea batatas]
MAPGYNPTQFLEVVTPPSTTRLWPLTYLDSSLAKYRAASAMSRGFKVAPFKFASPLTNSSIFSTSCSNGGIPNPISFSSSSSSGEWRHALISMEVATPKGEMQLTPTLEVEMMQPPPRGIMARAACFIPRAAPRTLMLITRSNSAASKSRMLFRFDWFPSTPALLNRMSRPPCLDTVDSIRRSTSSSELTSQRT